MNARGRLRALKTKHRCYLPFPGLCSAGRPSVQKNTDDPVGRPSFGGETGIRTQGPVRDTAFRVLHHRPLGHLSRCCKAGRALAYRNIIAEYQDEKQYISKKFLPVLRVKARAA